MERAVAQHRLTVVQGQPENLLSADAGDRGGGGGEGTPCLPGSDTASRGVGEAARAQPRFLKSAARAGGLPAGLEAPRAPKTGARPRPELLAFAAQHVRLRSHSAAPRF